VSDAYAEGEFFCGTIACTVPVDFVSKNSRV
jgi:hypothetical protein